MNLGVVYASDVKFGDILHNAGTLPIVVTAVNHALHIEEWNYNNQGNLVWLYAMTLDGVGQNQVVAPWTRFVRLGTIASFGDWPVFELQRLADDMQDKTKSERVQS